MTLLRLSGTQHVLLFQRADLNFHFLHSNSFPESRQVYPRQRCQGSGHRVVDGPAVPGRVTTATSCKVEDLPARGDLEDGPCQGVARDALSSTWHVPDRVSIGTRGLTMMDSWICGFQITVKPVLSSHTREAQKVAAYGRWLLNRGEYQYKFNIWEHFVCLLKTGWCLIEVTTNRFDCICNITKVNNL